MSVAEMILPNTPLESKLRQWVWYPFEGGQGELLAPDVDVRPYLARHDGVLWLDIQAIGSLDAQLLLEIFEFHPLCVEDCLHPQVIPKLEEFPNYLFLVVHGIVSQKAGQQATLQELNVFLGRNFLVTIHPDPLVAVDFVMDNLARGTSAIHAGPASLAHEVLDAVVDTYLPVLDGLDTHLNELEDILEADPTADIVKSFFELRRAILNIRRISIRQQEVFYWLSHRDIRLVSKEEALLFRDVYDHLVRVVELSESARDILSGMLNIHLSLMSNRMNDVMRILTIYSAILMPLTFIVGVYGMNFEHMPELHLKYGYPAVLVVMLAITVGMLLFFKRKNWL